MKVFFLILTTLFSTTLFAQTTYYVDATNGNDNNSGTSSSTAWMTINQVNNQSFVSGDSILFKRGETWSNERLEIVGWSGNTGVSISFDAYPNNADPKPIITTIIPHALSWTSIGSNLWKANTPPNYHPERIWMDGNEWLRGNSVSEIDGINFLWCYDLAGDLTLSSVGNPSIYTIEYASSLSPVYMEDAHFISVKNLDFQGGWTSIFINNNVTHVLFDQLSIGKNASSGIDINADTSISPHQLTIQNCSFDANFTLDYSMANFSPGTDNRGCSDGIFIQAADSCEITNCSFKNWGHASINIDGNPNGGSTVKVSTISVHDNFATSPDICYGGRMAIDDAHHCELYNNRIINTSVQCQFNGYNNHIHHNIIDGTTNPPIIDNAVEISAGIDIDSYSNTDVHHNIYENNLIKNTEGVGIQISTTGDYNIHDNIIRNNIIYNCGTVTDVQGLGLFVHSNTSSSQTSNNLIQNNLLFNSTTSNTTRFGNNSQNINAFNAFTGTQGYVIASNISNDPQFVNLATQDYHLQATSPCIDAGTVTLATLDFDGNNIPFTGSTYDIGIYEYQGLVELTENKQHDFTIYPNPAKDQFTIQTKDDFSPKKVSIFNANGALILEINNSTTISIPNLKGGVYFVYLESDSGTQIERLIVLK